MIDKFIRETGKITKINLYTTGIITALTFINVVLTLISILK